MKKVAFLLLLIALLQIHGKAQQIKIPISQVKAKNTSYSSYYINFERILLPLGYTDTIFQRNCHAYVYRTDTAVYFRVVTPRNYTYIVHDPSGIYCYQVRNQTLLTNCSHRGYEQELFSPFFASFYDFIEQECRFTAYTDEGTYFKLTYIPLNTDTTKESFTKELFVRKKDTLAFAHTWYGTDSIFGSFYNKIKINTLTDFPNALDSILIQNQSIQTVKTMKKKSASQSLKAKDSVFLNKQFENIQFNTLSGKGLNLYDMKAKHYIVDFSYLGCPPCLTLHQKLSSVKNQLDSSNTEIITLNPIDKDTTRINNYLKNAGITHPMYLCGNEVVRSCQVDAYPKVFVLDSNFNIKYVLSGYDEELVNRILKLVK
ncbi:MAG: TlpA disulfide reductase family protein [Bacteroidota bacterium]